jgi:hypothetical protein
MAKSDVDDAFAALQPRYLPSQRRPDADHYLKSPPVPMAASMSEENFDLILDQIASGVGLRELAQRYNVTLRAVQCFLEHPSRSARVLEARRQSAWLWDEKAEDEIRSAQDQLDISKAREIASHYRWRAAAIAPREYGKAGAQDPIDPTLGALAQIGAAAMREQLAAMVGALGIGQVVAVQDATPALPAPKVGKPAK